MTWIYQKCCIRFRALSRNRRFLNFSLLGLCFGFGLFPVACLNKELPPGKIAADSPPPGTDTAPNSVRALTRAKDEQVVLDELDKFAAKFSMPGLRKKSLPASETELRIWIGMGPGKTRGVIIGNERTIYLAPTGDVGHERPPVAQNLIPKSGSSSLWDDITATGLLNLPPEPESEDVDPRNDSDVIVVETKTGSDYKYILYGAACYSQGRNAGQLIAALEKIGQSIGLEFYKCPAN